MKRIYLVVVLSLFCGSALSQNPVKIKTSELIPMVERIGLDSTLLAVDYDIYMIDPVVAKQLLNYVDKEDKNSRGFQFYKYLQNNWLSSDSEQYDPDAEKEVEEFVTLIKKYNSLGDIDFSKEPKFVKWSEKFNWFDTLLYNGIIGLWTFEISDEYSSWRISYKMELKDGNKLRLVPLAIIHGSRTW